MTFTDSTRDLNETITPCGLLSATKGWYLLNVYWLASRNKKKVRTGELADRLDSSPASVSEMLRELAADSFLEYEKYAGVEMTPRGTTIAESLAWRQCVVTSFFDLVLAHDIDCHTSYRIGYTVPEDSIYRLREWIEYPSIDTCRRIGGGSDGCLVEVCTES